MPPVFDRTALQADRDPLRQLIPDVGKLPKLDAGVIWAQWLKGLKELTGLDLSSPQALVLSLGDIIGGALDPQNIAGMIGKVLGYVGGPLQGLEQLAAWAGDALFGLINPSRLPMIPLGHVTKASPNLLVNGAFADTVAIDDPAGKWSLDATVGRTTAGSAMTLADGTIHELLSVDLIPVTPGEKLDVEGWVKRSNVVGTNGSVYLGLTAYGDVRGVTQATTAPNRPTIALMASPGGTGDWQKLGGQYVVPEGVASVRVRLAVTSGATAGTLWFDDLAASKGRNLLHIDFVDGLGDELAGAWAAISGAIEDIGQRLGLDKWQEFLNAAAGGIGGTIHSIVDRIMHLGLDGTFDASQLVNVRNIPPLPALVVQGIQGLTNIGASIQAQIDYLWQAFTGSGGNDKSMAALAQAAQQVSLDITQAVRLAEAHEQLLLQRRNKPVHHAITDTAEATFDLSTIASGTTPPNVAVTSQFSIMGFIRCAEDSNKGFVQWLGSGISGITGLWVNVYRMNAAGDLTLVHTSPDLQAQLTPGWSWLTYVFSGPNQTPVVAGDVLAAEIVVMGTGSHLVASMAQSWVPAHPSAAPKRMSAQRNPSAFRSPVSIPAGSVGYTANGAVPWLSFGITNVPADYHAPEAQEYEFMGTYTAPVPAWAQYLDLVGVGGGGGGGSSFNFLSGQGGGPGHWAGRTLQRGVDFPADATSVKVVVGGGGGITGAEGRNGDSSYVQWVDTAGVTQTFVMAGGEYGGQGPNHNPSNPNKTSGGWGSGNFQWRGRTFFGGTDVGQSTGGSWPGGAGGGAAPYVQGAPGERGAVWVVARQVETD
ncbi:minor tail protein [Mycobacterium phage Marshawn]|uniref:Minor tail protein n=1 Tax=Mycobacterium phage Marshawn TaxID=2652423 RepID=A0A5P8D711_9CAUD|nr:minor tail protein [Mycobacterium phage Marshawn]QFP94814.1 minor tail protein [Mycobacterium phage Marshawn]